MMTGSVVQELVRLWPVHWKYHQLQEVCKEGLVHQVKGYGKIINNVALNRLNNK